MMKRTLLVSVLFVLLIAGPVAAEDPPTPAPDAPVAPDEEISPDPLALPPPLPPQTDPRGGEVPLPAGGGWHASLVIDNQGVGIWTVKSFDVFETLGCPDVVGLDDLGRCHVLVSYSGRWTPITTVSDGKWLGGLTHGDLDPRIRGSEIYTGSQKGNVYQVVAYSHGIVDNRLIAHLPGREIHTLVTGELDPTSAGPELIVFTRPGGLYRMTPTGPDGTFEIAHLQDLPGRVRDAIVLPSERGGYPGIATVSRTGRLEILRLTREGPQWQTIYRASMGLGRIALRPPRSRAPQVLYATHDDGRILRLERAETGGYAVDEIYFGPPGPRGIAAGRFDEDPDKETVAIFGYSGRVELLTRADGAWTAETLFQDSDKGHWLAVAELDGRNATREILSSGYSGRVVLLARPPGYGKSGAAAER
ncbi:MAG: hypothetical protein ACYTG6_13800 [Planctomycetota bacterium]|jgi:hypothetical protein